MKLYHYTSKEGAEGIVESKRILKSRTGARRGDVLLGEGVYLTALAPKEGKLFIAMNNYDGIRVNANSLKKVEVPIEITIDDNDPKLVDGRADEKMAGRDVFVYQGDINLKKFKWSVVAVRESADGEKENPTKLLCLYHYTSEGRVKQIEKEGTIRSTLIKQCYGGGEGVYLTTAEDKSKPSGIRLHISRSNNRLECVDDESDLYVFWGDIDFDDFQHCQWEVVPMRTNLLCLYHYTSANKVRQIVKRGYIRATLIKQCYGGGEGVYLTTVKDKDRPSGIRLHISKSNRNLERVSDDDDDELYVYWGDIDFDKFQHCQWETVSM